MKNLAVFDNMLKQALETELYIASDEGNLELVKYITTSPNIKNRPDLFGNFCYPLRSACMYGHVELLDFLMNFPSANIKSKLEGPALINEGINNAYMYKQKSVISYFEQYCTKQHNDFVNDKSSINRVIQMYVKGGDKDLEYLVEFVHKIQDKKNIEFVSVLKKTTEQHAKELTNFLVKTMQVYKEDTVFNELLLYTALYYNSEEMVDIANSHIEKNLSQYINGESLEKLINNRKYDIVNYLIVNTDYMPDEDNLSYIYEQMIKKTMVDNDKLKLINLYNNIKTKKFNEKLHSELKVADSKTVKIKL